MYMHAEPNVSQQVEKFEDGTAAVKRACDEFDSAVLPVKRLKPTGKSKAA